jgi:hypothetical protein
MAGTTLEYPARCGRSSVVGNVKRKRLPPPMPQTMASPALFATARKRCSAAAHARTDLDRVLAGAVQRGALPREAAKAR